MNSFKVFFKMGYLLLIRNPLDTIGLNISTIIFMTFIFVFTNIISVKNPIPNPLLIDSKIYEKDFNNSVLKYQNQTNNSTEDFVIAIWLLLYQNLKKILLIGNYFSTKHICIHYRFCRIWCQTLISDSKAKTSLRMT